MIVTGTLSALNGEAKSKRGVGLLAIQYADHAERTPFKIVKRNTDVLIPVRRMAMMMMTASKRPLSLK
jgi:hypothetical protein